MLAAAASGAAVPVEWDVEVTRVQPAMFSAYRGETLELSARMLRGGRPFEVPLEGAALYWQTNGMGSAYWAASASCASNVLSAVWSPTNDVGAATYNCFIGEPGGSYRAAFRLRLLDSPGASPNSFPLPVARLDFAAVEVANAPYYDKAETEAKIVELAPAPGNYAAVSNAAVHAAATNALQDTALESHASQLSQLSQSLDAKADKKRQGELLSFDWLNTTDDCTLEFDQESEGWNWHGSIRQGGLYKSFRLCYDDAWLFKSWVIMLGGQEPDWQYTNNVPRTRTALKFGQTNLIRTNETWAEYPIVYADELASATNGLLRGEYAALTNNAAFTSAVAAVSPPTDISGKQDNLPYPTNAIPYAAISGKPSLATVATSGSYNDLSNKPTIPTVPTNVSSFNNDAGYLTGYTESDPTIKSWAKANTKPTYTAAEVGAATAEDVYRIVAGTNVLLVVTNYNSAVHAPLMSLQHLDPDTGEYVVYWNESRRHGITLTNAMEHADAAVAAERARADAAYAPRAWSGTTSGLGADAPPGVTWISTPETVIAGGYEYEKVVTSAGAVWVLASNGLTAGATTNGYFRIEASDGTELFSIEKTDSYLVGVPADGITRSGNTVTIPLNVVAPSHPYIRAAKNLVNAAWTKEDENGFACDFASISWSGSSGAYVATVTCAEPQAFFYFEFMHEGTSKIRNTAATEMMGGIYYGGATYMPTVSGTELKFIRQ